MKLHLGSGDKRFHGFINVDHDINCNPDFCIDMEKDIFPFSDNSVTEVIAHHVLEHMGEGYFHFIKELYRVCDSGAIIDIVVPHHRHEYYADDPTHRRPITPSGLRLFSKKYNDLCHEQNAAASRLGYFFGVDFEIIESTDIPDPAYIPIFQGKPMGEVLKYMAEHNGCIMEVHIKLVVVK